MKINTLTYVPSYRMLHAIYCYILQCYMQYATCYMLQDAYYMHCTLHSFHFILLFTRSKPEKCTLLQKFINYHSIYILKSDAHDYCSYARARARIDLKFLWVIKGWWLNLSLKFEKDPISGCGEIDSQSWSIFIKNTENTLILAALDHNLKFWNWGEAPLRFQ